MPRGAPDALEGNNMACNICRENHGTERGLSFDGLGVNGCDAYRSRIATFRPAKNDNDLAGMLGPMFAAAPDLVECVRDWVQYMKNNGCDRGNADWDKARAALEKAGVAV